MCCQVERVTKDMTASAPSTLKIMVVAPPDGNIITVGAKPLHMLARQMTEPACAVHPEGVTYTPRKAPDNPS